MQGHSLYICLPRFLYIYNPSGVSQITSAQQITRWKSQDSFVREYLLTFCILKLLGETLSRWIATIPKNEWNRGKQFPFVVCIDSDSHHNRHHHGSRFIGKYSGTLRSLPAAKKIKPPSGQHIFS